MWLDLREWDGTKYTVVKNIDLTEVLEYTYVQKDGTEADEFKIKFKPTQFYKNLVFDKFSDKEVKRPLILVSNEIYYKRWFVFINDRLKVEDLENNRYVELTGSDIKYFNENKILNANTNHADVGENDLPENFAKYIANATMDNHLKYIYDTWLNPRVLTHGVLATVLAPHRKLKGLNSVTIESGLTNSINLSIEQEPLKDAIEHVYKKFELDLVTRMTLNEQQLIDITVKAPVYVNENVVRSQTDILETIIEGETKHNYFFGTGWGNNATNVFEISNSDFTSIEKKEDYAFVSGQNNTYLTNTATTYLKRSLDKCITNLKKVKLRKAFDTIFAGDLINIQGEKVRIKQIQESYKVGSPIEYDMELKGDE